MERISPADCKSRTFSEHLRRYEFACEYVKGATVLDIACGTGYGSHALITSGMASRVIGVDVSEDAISFAMDRYKASSLEFKLGDATDMGFDADLFEVAVSFETIEHVSDYRRFISEIRRVLKPGGTFILSTPNRRLEPRNRYHVSEFSSRKFKNMLDENFSRVQLFRQDLLGYGEWTRQYVRTRAMRMGSRILPRSAKELVRPLVESEAHVEGEEAQSGPITAGNLGRCRFFIAVCSQ